MRQSQLNWCTHSQINRRQMLCLCKWKFYFDQWNRFLNEFEFRLYRAVSGEQHTFHKFTVWIRHLCSKVGECVGGLANVNEKCLILWCMLKQPEGNSKHGIKKTSERNEQVWVWIWITYLKSIFYSFYVLWLKIDCCITWRINMKEIYMLHPDFPWIWTS